ncbi:hypothetical protein K491DRAFT_763398 [Lophiostoma macrostomum CBS 122681]|uniref:Uncharacterized protein n=1 Tax=Lophiostoma macrostomum CBS 122681 TaxID=1314788 RepID=A0A6A6SJ76_9PLEO|nr:hypothetical protein K491DRAFT_763398 [Lophiostoma macrostomum CBS 122681]
MSDHDPQPRTERSPKSSSTKPRKPEPKRKRQSAKAIGFRSLYTSVPPPATDVPESDWEKRDQQNATLRKELGKHYIEEMKSTAATLLPSRSNRDEITYRSADLFILEIEAVDDGDYHFKASIEAVHGPKDAPISAALWETPDHHKDDVAAIKELQKILNDILETEPEAVERWKRESQDRKREIWNRLKSQIEQEVGAQLRDIERRFQESIESRLDWKIERIEARLKKLEDRFQKLCELGAGSGTQAACGLHSDCRSRETQVRRELAGPIIGSAPGGAYLADIDRSDRPSLKATSSSTSRPRNQRHQDEQTNTSERSPKKQDAQESDESSDDLLGTSQKPRVAGYLF